LEIGGLTIANIWVCEELIAVEITHLPISDFFAVVIASFAIHRCSAASTVCGAHMDDACVLDIWIILSKR
jgi:hypothetical protein